MEGFQDFNTDRINDWRDKTDEIQKIKEEWDAIGLVPKENADQINKRFWGIYKAFFHNKNQFFKALDEQKMQNLKLKTELCEQAEAIKDSNDWDSTKEQLIQLQKKWKTIGRVPDKYSDKIWERFRAACNEFFDRKQADSQQKEVEQEKLSSFSACLILNEMHVLSSIQCFLCTIEKISHLNVRKPGHWKTIISFTFATPVHFRIFHFLTGFFFIRGDKCHQFFFLTPVNAFTD